MPVVHTPAASSFRGVHRGLSSAAVAGLLLLAPSAALAQVVGPAGSVAPSYQPGIDVLHYEFALTLPDTGSRIEGLATVHVRRTAAVDTLRLDLLALDVSRVTVSGAPVNARRDSARIHIPLPPGSSDSLAIGVTYAGSPTDGLVISRDPEGRWQAFGDNFPDRGRHWLPTVDHPSDKATVRWIVDAPDALRVVSNGTLAEETPLGGDSSGRTRTIWSTTRPLPTYLMVIAAAPLAFVDLGRTACGLAESPGCVPQAVYLAAEVRDFAPGPFARAGDMVAYFSRLVAPYPYEKLAHLQTTTRFGGMENASAIFYSDRAFRQRSLGIGLVAHETAHQWFGNAVTEREWGHLWLSEGFATYFAQLWTEHDISDSAFRAGMEGIRRQVLGAAVVAERPVLDTTQRVYLELLNANSYQKGGFTLHMLRAVVGDSAFFRGVRRYYAAHVHGTALTDDLQAAMEAESGEQLGWFFDQWLRRPGFAELTIEWRHDRASRRLTLKVRQGGRFGSYRVPLDLDLVAPDGTARRVRVDIPASAESSIVVEDVAARPSRIVADPAVRVLGTVVVR